MCCSRFSFVLPGVEIRVTVVGSPGRRSGSCGVVGGGREGGGERGDGGGMWR